MVMVMVMVMVNGNGNGNGNGNVIEQFFRTIMSVIYTFIYIIMKKCDSLLISLNVV